MVARAPQNQETKQVAPGDTLTSVARELASYFSDYKNSALGALTIADFKAIIQQYRVLRPDPILLFQLRNASDGNTLDTLFLGEKIPIGAIKDLKLKRNTALLEEMVIGLRANRDIGTDDPAALSSLKPPARPTSSEIPSRSDERKKRPSPERPKKHEAKQMRTHSPKYLPARDIDHILDEVREQMPKALQPHLPDLDRSEAQIAVESSRNIYATTPKSSAQGLTQMVVRTARNRWDDYPPMPEALRALANQYAAKGYGPTIAPGAFQKDYLFNPVVAVWMQQKHLSILQQRYSKRLKDRDDVSDAAFRAYYAGEGAIDVSLGLMQAASLRNVSRETAKKWAEDSRKYLTKINKQS
jgi:hypothetical protein